MSRYTTLTQQDKDGNDYTVVEAESGTRGPASGKRWYTCHMCGFDYRRDEVVLQGGAAFCIPGGDYKLIGEQNQGGQI